MTSPSGLAGNLGQTDFGAAKRGLTRIALDIQKFNVRFNCIAPFAWSRMIGGHFHLHVAAAGARGQDPAFSAGMP